MDTRLITVEGLYGAGKSTITQHLAQQLDLNQKPVQWVDEYHFLVPFFADFFLAFQHGPDGLESLFRTAWRNVKAMLDQSDCTFVIDGAFFTNSFFRLLASGLAPSAILGCADGLWEMLAPFRPRIFYLARDIDRALAAVCATRGSNWTSFIIEHTNHYPYQQARQRQGLEGVAAFFREAEACFLSLIPRLTFSTYIVNTTAAEWDQYQREIVTALGLTPLPITIPTIPSARSQSYVGSYDGPDTFPGTPHFRVAWHNNRLIFQTTYSDDNVLVPETEMRFNIQGTRMLVEFEHDHHHEVSGLRLTYFDGQTYQCTKQRIATP
jgi:hypothetical protein